MTGFEACNRCPCEFRVRSPGTPYHIDLLYRRRAIEMGFERFERTESLNASDDFVDLLAGLVIHRFEEALSRS